MKIANTDIRTVYKKTKSVYVTVMDRITDRRVQTPRAVQGTLQARR